MTGHLLAAALIVVGGVAADVLAVLFDRWFLIWITRRYSRLSAPTDPKDLPNRARS